MEENQNPSGSAQDLSENQETSNDTVAYRTYQKVLSEVKTAKERAKEYEAKLAEYQAKVQSFEEAKMQEEGKLNDLVGHLRDRAKTLEQQLQEKEAMFSFSKTADAIKLEAAKQGCVDVDAFMSLVRKDDLKRVEVGEGFNPNMEDVSSLVNDFKKRYDKIKLFKSESIQTNDIPIDTKPKGETNSVEKLKAMDTDELEKILKTIK